MKLIFKTKNEYQALKHTHTQIINLFLLFLLPMIESESAGLLGLSCFVQVRFMMTWNIDNRSCNQRNYNELWVSIILGGELRLGQGLRLTVESVVITLRVTLRDSIDTVVVAMTLIDIVSNGLQGCSTVRVRKLI